jgi:hypothetical protein
MGSKTLYVSQSDLKKTHGTIFYRTGRRRRTTAQTLRSVIDVKQKSDYLNNTKWTRKLYVPFNCHYKIPTCYEPLSASAQVLCAVLVANRTHGIVESNGS